MPPATKSSKSTGSAPKYDWDSLRMQFFTSQQKTVKGFLKEFVGIEENWNSRKNTLGWLEQREVFKKEAQKLADEQLKQKMAEEIYQPSLKELWEMHKATVDLIKVALMGIQQACVVTDKGKKKVIQIPNAQDLKRFWEMIRVEKGQSTDIVWDENFIQTEDELWE